MPPLSHEPQVLKFLQVVVTLLTAVHVRKLFADDVLYSDWLQTFPKPDFRTNFTLRSNQGTGSFKEVRHGLNVDPFYVRVYAKPLEGSNSGFSFNGIGSSQSSPSKSSYGGLIFAYNSEFVRIWAPMSANGHIVFVKDGWGGEQNTQESDEAEVIVEVWKYGPAPTFQIELVINTHERSSNQAYHIVDHELRKLPERVVVRISPAESSVNAGFWFHGVGASQNPNPTSNFGGVIFAYNEKYVRLWAPDGVNNNTGCIFVGKEWGSGVNSEKVSKCKVETRLWVNQLPTPTFRQEWFSFKGQRNQNSFKEIVHGRNQLPSLVLVQLRAINGRNVGYVFEAQGAVQSDDDGNNEYGGVVFAYDENRVRIWAPSRNDGSKKGYPLLVKSGWGYGSNLQAGRDEVHVRVLVYYSICNTSTEFLYEGKQCINKVYDSYKFVISQWSECSSICNNGTKTRSFTGCDVTSKETVHSCNFEDGSFCGWSNERGSGSLRWVVTNASTPAVNTGPLWGHPKGSFYAYTDTTDATIGQEVTFTSPNVKEVGKCYLRFFWNMHGKDIGTLRVFVNTKNPLVGPFGRWIDSGWSMTGSQGNIWRAAFVNLEKFSKMYQLQFKHSLPDGSDCDDRPCPECKPMNKCPNANVAIAGIRLDCQKDAPKAPLQTCRKREVPLTGCEILAVSPSSKGPAYSTERVHLDTYVKANGSLHDLIASYEFKVSFLADFVVWKQMFATSNKTNDIEFKIDEGDWILWIPPQKASHALWTQYYRQTFTLKPGIHTISLRQVEKGFRLLKLAVVPVTLSVWTDLGMQSRYIPDSFLTARPLSYHPPPRFGRIHAKDAWCSGDQNKGFVYFQIRLPQLALVSGISVQGGQDILQSQNNYWIKSFRLKISLDGEKYTWYRDVKGQGRRTFEANRDGSTIQNHTLMFAAPARGIRIYPMDWQNWICLRAELYGFYLGSEMCASIGPVHPTSSSCVGDRNCGQNAECATVSKQDYSNNLLNVSGESCQCNHGYHGPSCEHYGCLSNPCLNGGRCSEANGTFTCNCQLGYHGYTCQHPCKSGYYGFNCSNKCNCTEHGSCDVATGHCHCRRGYHGASCEKVCSPGYFGYNCAQNCQCKNSASCDPKLGSCNCTAGWTGEVCDKPCPLNTWGVSCSQNCSCQKSATFCNRFTGNCFCLPGYHGEECQYLCPSGTYGVNCSYHCKCQNNATCSRTDGTCNCTQPGWAGVLCDRPCPGGSYGVNCVHKCNCRNGGACDRKTGSCTCRSGFFGQFCDKPCSQGFWGQNCSMTCSCVNGALCNSVNGQCTCRTADGCQCSPGWTGSDCSKSCNDSSWGSNCQNVCQCQHNGICNQVNGSCLCLPGYKGPKCEHSCSPDYYGQKCAFKCGCTASQSTGCDPVTGACMCKPGFTGRQCDVPCPAGKWGLHCFQSCSCDHGGCEPVSGNCTCDRGWKGERCDQVCSSCGQTCPTCFHGNGSCDQVSGKCPCFAGYQGSSCVEACSVGYYGDKCQQKCDCGNGGTCHHVTGKCLCKLGWTGARCNEACPEESFGHNCTQTCSCVRGTCDPMNGSCACPSGYRGYLCDRLCSGGAGCSERCQCANGARCDYVTGQCVCPAGWTGKTCQRSCRQVSVIPGVFGANCSQRCICPGSCHPVTGSCSCPRGFQGPNCQEACADGWYGANCSQRCKCINSASCNHVDGSCTCTPGWSGVGCTERCPAGYYGMLCASKCQCSVNGTEGPSLCNSVTGECNCSLGYHGFRCEEQCREGFYGKNCSQRCQCQNSHACSITDGSCSCKPGYYGAACHLPCPKDRYGANCNNTCQCMWSNTHSCNRIDGTCGCRNGYIGVDCESACPEGSYGRDCSGTCTCQNGAVCDHVKGTCACTAGFKGQSCETACAEGRFGVNCSRRCLCRNGAKCSRFDGQCDCAPGFFSKYCEYECPSGRYGVNCTNICDCNLRNSPKCDPKTGECICFPGFKGPRCDKPCEDGFYGKNCQKPCPVCSSHVIGPCQKAHGNCSCSPGYQGYRCFDDCGLQHYGLHCKQSCQCTTDELCHHIDGLCLDMSRGKFSLIVNDSMEELHDRVRMRDIKRGLEKLMELYFDEKPPDDEVAAATASDDGSALAQSRLDVLDGVNGSSTTTDRPTSRSSVPSSHNNEKESTPQKVKHVFMVRLLEDEMQPVVKEDLGDATRVVCVLLDNFTVVDGHYVDEVLSRVPRGMIASELQVDYYTGKLYKKKPGSKVQMHLPLIIGVSVGFFLIVTIIALFALIRRRYRRKSGFASYKRGNTKDQAEFELQPWIGRNTGYLLAFDNPYYDVLAAMGLDDDIEEDYYNPLYDDVSMYSDSGENTSEESCHKDLSSMVIRS